MKTQFISRTLRGITPTVFLISILLVPLVVQPLAAATSAVWNGGSGNWSDASHWSTNPIFPSNGDSATYQASMNAGTLTLDRPISIDRFSISGGTFNANSPMNLTTRFDSTGGTVTFAPGASLFTPLMKIAGGVAGGTVNFNSNVTLPPTELSGDRFGGVLGGSGDMTIPGAFAWSGGLIGGTGTTTFVGDHSIVNTPESLRSERKLVIVGGTLDWCADGSNAFIVFSNGGSFTNSPDATFLIHGSFNSYSLGHTTQEFIYNAGVFRQDSTNGLFSDIYLPFRNAGIVESVAGTLQFGGGYRQTAGITKLRGITFASTVGPRNVIFDGGSVVGSTNIDAPTFNGAILSIGDPFGEIRVTDSLTLLNSSRLMFDIGGLTRISKYDSLYADTLDLGGILDIRMANGFESSIRASDSFNIVTTSFRTVPTGAFTNISDGRVFTTDGLGSFRVTINNTGVVLDNFQPIPEPLGLASIAASAVIFLTGRKFH